MIKNFIPPYEFVLETMNVTDEETLELARDSQQVLGCLYQGMPPLGAWVENRVSSIVKKWLPDWVLSHAQIYDQSRPDLQSCSWDLVIHKPIPDELGFPPPAADGHGYPLVPKKLCCAVVDVKSQFGDIKKYVNKRAFDVRNESNVLQLELLQPEIVPIIFTLTTKNSPNWHERPDNSLGITVISISKVIERPGKRIWQLYRREDGMLPIDYFKTLLLRAVADWENRNS